jgi:ubiquinone/menaquinone biosynthesis C-methylase UbiE
MYAEHMTRYLAAKKLAKGKVVLDIASGSGYGSNMLAEVASKVYGVDVSIDAINYAKENYIGDNIEYILGSAEKIPIPDSSIDLVVSFETIEHIKDYETFVKEIKRVLKKDGLAIISTPNDKEFPEGNEFHLHEFKYDEFSNLIKESFNNQKIYSQATWAYVQIADEGFINKNEAVDRVEVHNFAPLDKDKYLYFCVLCSDRDINEKIEPIGGLGGHYSARELGDIFSHYQKQIDEHKDEHQKTKIKLQLRERELHDIVRSKSYKISKIISITKRVAWAMLINIKRINPRRVNMIIRNRNHIEKAYGSECFTRDLKTTATSDIAVILHLYYTDMAKIFKKKLKNISHLNYDLFITISEDNKISQKEILKDFPNARIAVVPNCGRDVLPFVMIMKSIENLGYKKILKLHSKKSPHRKDGDGWRNRIIDNLLPDSFDTINKAVELLDKKNVAIIGSKPDYISMLVNFSATIHHTKRLISKIFGKTFSNNLMGRVDEYGFFAGTMFWARADAIYGIIDTVDIKDFEPEFGQEDSTLAHALERLMIVIPELQGKGIYGLDGVGLIQISYHTTNIPEWSDAALDK